MDRENCRRFTLAVPRPVTGTLEKKILSSAVGHCFTAIGIGQGTKTKLSIGWIILLCIAACAPDIDYAFLAVGVPLRGRITHSICVALVFPIAVTATWSLVRQEWISIQKALALIVTGLSHLALDLLVGVTPLPLLWPFSHHRFKLPFGLLPNAGSIRLTNYYLYRNLFIELGVILPLVAMIFILTRTRRRALALACGCLSFPFMGWAANLTR